MNPPCCCSQVKPCKRGSSGSINRPSAAGLSPVLASNGYRQPSPLWPLPTPACRPSEAVGGAIGLLAESAILLFALLVAAWFAEDPDRIRIVLRTAVLTGAVASIYGIAQYFGWDPFLPAKAYQAGEDWFTIVRPPATFGHADYFADWLVMVAFFAVALARLEWKANARTTAALATLAIVLSGTRSAMLGLLAGAVVFLAIARPRVDRKAILSLAAAVACLTLLYISPPGAKLRARVHWSLDDVRGGARLLLWRDSLHMAMTRPFLRYGPETFTGQFPRFESVELSRAYPDFYQESPHNMFLDALVSRGIPGALALLALCAFALYAVPQRRRASCRRSWSHRLPAIHGS